ncbi:MAG: hypothetical protein DBX47_05995 [Clostridiales bacterium]|nr:MAG: hypothetical protein DBX47_05995 [Clostridiales bacterium]
MRNTKWLWATFSILSAVFIIASQVTDFVNIGFWSILGTILLSAVLIQSIIHRNFFGIFIPLALGYKIYCQPLNLLDISVWILLSAAVLLAIGFSFIFKSRPPKLKYKFDKCEHFNETVYNADDNNPYAKVNFGASTKYLHSTSLQAGQFYTSFGSMEVYLDQAQLSPEGAEIYVDCKFGAIELYVPSRWNVKNKVHVSMGAADIPEHRTASDPSSPVLIISGNVSFGAVEVNYI